MRILLSNDDGYQSRGLACLARTLAANAEVTVVAPDRNRSGASNSLTLETPVRTGVSENGFIYVNGTPTDCVHLAVNGLLREEPDMVVSGINHGANLGDDIIYSGTVAAAMEGRFLGLPSIAVSLVGENPSHFDTAARAVARIIPDVGSWPLPRDSILNINVPDVPWEALRGVEVTRLGHRHKAEPVVCGNDPRGRAVYWVGPPGAEQDAGPGTDFHAVRNGFVSITPIQVDLTRHEAIERLRERVRQLSLA